MSFSSRKVRKKGKHEYSTGKIKLKAARPWKFVEGKVVFTWHIPDNWTKQSTRVLPTSDILSLLKLRRGKCSYFMREPFMVALLGGESSLRAEYIPFWNLSGPGDACGKNFLSLADGEPNPFSLNLDSLPSLGSLTHPLVLENLSCVLAKPSWMRSTLSSGAGWAQGAVKCINTLSILASPCPIFPQRCLKILACPKKWEQN